MNQNSEGSEARPTGIDLGFGGLSADVGGHIGHFYRNEQEMMDVMGPYFEAGLKGGDKCTLVCRSGIGETVLAGLTNRGTPVEAALSSGQFVLHEGMGSVEATVEMFSDLIAEARAAGYRLIRIGGDMAKKLFADHKLGDLWIEPWPLEKVSIEFHRDRGAQVA